MVSLRRTILWVTGTSAALYLLMTVSGLVAILGYDNRIAATIMDNHLGAVVSIYARLLCGYLLAGVLLGILLHPIASGWKAVPAALALCALGMVHKLTSETHLLFGPMHSAFCAGRDAIPLAVRDRFRPWMLEAGFALLALVSLYRWTRRSALPWRAAAAAVAAVALAVAFLPTAAAAPVRGARTGPPCFLLIATDSLRADHLSCNGYGRETSPSIDALAARGTNFANCLVPTASTHESWISLLSSTEPRTNGLRHMFPSRATVEAIEREQVFFPRVLQEQGYKTAAIGGWCGTTFGIFDVGMDEVDVTDNQNHMALLAEATFSVHLPAASFLDNLAGRLLLPELDRVSFTRGSGALTRRAKHFLGEAAREDRPFFLTVVYHVTHLPYSASYPYYTAFVDPGYRGRNRYRIDFRIDELIRRGFDNDLTDEEKRHIVDLYDGAVLEFDAQVGALVAELERLGLADRTIVGVWADHGDNLHEHGTTLGHGVTLFGGDGANHVPAIFAGPGIPRRRVEKLVRSYDLTPTWARWLGVTPPKRWEGEDLSGPVPDLAALLETSYLLYRQPVPDLEQGERPLHFPRVDEAVRFDPDFDFNPVLRPELEDVVCSTKCFAVREGPWKLIVVPGEDGPIYRLFHLGSDPECRRDVRAEHEDVFQRLQRRLPQS